MVNHNSVRKSFSKHQKQGSPNTCYWVEHAVKGTHPYFYKWKIKKWLINNYSYIIMALTEVTNFFLSLKKIQRTKLFKIIPRTLMNEFAIQKFCSGLLTAWRNMFRWICELSEIKGLSMKIYVAITYNQCVLVLTLYTALSLYILYSTLTLTLLLPLCKNISKDWRTTSDKADFIR